MSRYKGNYLPGQTVRVWFNSVDSTQAPVDPASISGNIYVYKNGDASSEVTTGVTLGATFDALTGLTSVAIDTSADATFYAINNSYVVVIKSGTVDGTSVAGQVIGEFSICDRADTSDVFAAGKVNDAGATATSFVTNLGGTDLFGGLAALQFTSGTYRGHVRMISGYNTGTQVITLLNALPNAPANNDRFIVRSLSPALVTMLKNLGTDGLVKVSANAHTAGVTVAAVTGNVGGNVGGSVGSVTGNVGGSVGSIATGGIAAASFAAGAIDNAAIATDAIGSAEMAATAVAEIAGAVWDELRSGHTTTGTFGHGVASVQGSVTGSVASVTGNVGGSVGSIGVGAITSSSFSAGAIDAAAIAADAIGASELAATAVAEIADAVWDEAQSGHTTAGTFGYNLDARVSAATGGGGGGATAAEVWAYTDRSLTADGLRAVLAETDIDIREAVSLIYCAIFGANTGMGTGSPVVKNPTGTQTRATMNADGFGNHDTVVVTPYSL